MKKPCYETPRAVKLGDAKTGSLWCTNGRTGTGTVCQSNGFAISPHNVCANGLLVRN
jgi:hypothetical protein